MPTIRAFIAIPLPEAVAGTLGAVSERLATALPPRTVRWVEPDRMHLTLHFLGDIDGAGVPALGAVLNRVAGAHAPFELTLDRLGCFPDARRPRVIWVGLADAGGRASRLQADLGKALADGGWPHDTKAFQPHLTLGRVRRQERGLAGLPFGEAVQPLVVPVIAVELIESRLRPAGPIYTVRQRSPLGG